MSLLHSWVLGGQQVTAVDLGRAGAGGCEHRPMTGNQLDRQGAGGGQTPELAALRRTLP
jgi:hypothetical protein